MTALPLSPEDKNAETHEGAQASEAGRTWNRAADGEVWRQPPVRSLPIRRHQEHANQDRRDHR